MEELSGRKGVVVEGNGDGKENAEEEKGFVGMTVDNCIGSVLRWKSELRNLSF